jgi:hypothetical protein
MAVGSLNYAGYDFRKIFGLLRSFLDENGSLFQFGLDYYGGFRTRNTLGVEVERK